MNRCLFGRQKYFQSIHSSRSSFKDPSRHGWFCWTQETAASSRNLKKKEADINITSIHIQLLFIPQMKLSFTHSEPAWISVWAITMNTQGVVYTHMDFGFFFPSLWINSKGSFCFSETFWLTFTSALTTYSFPFRIWQVMSQITNVCLRANFSEHRLKQRLSYDSCQVTRPLQAFPKLLPSFVHFL